MSMTMLHAVDVQASAKDVYGAIASEEGVRSFWTSDANVPSEAGGMARLGFPTAPIPLELRVEELEPEKRVRWSCVAEWPYWKGTEITWSLEPGEAGATRVMLRHHGWPEEYPEHEFAMVNFVWGQVLGRLKGYVETGQPQPFFP